MRRGLIEWSKTELPESVFDARIAAMRTAMAAANIDTLVAYTNFTRPSAVSWLCAFIPYWSECALVVPKAGPLSMVSAVSPRGKPWIESTTYSENLLFTPKIGPETARVLKESLPAGATIGVVELDEVPAAVGLALKTVGAKLVDATDAFVTARAAGDAAERRARENRRRLRARRAGGVRCQRPPTRPRPSPPSISTARRLGAEESYVAIAVNARKIAACCGSRAGARSATCSPCARRVAYKGTWVRMVRTVVRNDTTGLVAKATEQFAAAVAELPKLDKLAAMDSWLVETRARGAAARCRRRLGRSARARHSRPARSSPCKRSTVDRRHPDPARRAGHRFRRRQTRCVPRRPDVLGDSLSLVLALDIGGTFTDLVAFDLATGEVHQAKSSTTPYDLAVGIRETLAKSGLPIATAETFIHGSTVAINTAIERTGARTALVVTEGMRDVYKIGRGSRPEAYNLFFKRPEPYVPRHRTLEIVERLNADGEVITVLDRAERHRRRKAAQHRRHRIGRGRVPALVGQPRSRSGGRRDHRARSAGALPLALARDPARIPRVRAHVDDRAQRLRRPAREALPRRPRKLARRIRLQRPALDHAVQRRHDDARNGQARAGQHDGVGTGRRHHRGGRSQRQPRLQERARLRHGRHDRQSQPRAEQRTVDRARLLHRRPRERSSGHAAGRRHHRSRHRRRQHRVDRRGRRAQSRPAQRGRPSGPGVLRAGRHRADRHRCQRHSRPPQPEPVSRRRDAARRRGRARSDPHDDRRSARPLDRSSGARDHQDRGRRDVAGGARRVGRTRLRSARFRDGRLRRRGSAALGANRARTARADARSSRACRATSPRSAC